jgi:60 kDa SS-A/Ro ribonucleoprotein
MGATIGQAPGQSARSMRGWGRGLRSALARWYTEKPAASVAFQAVKYQGRDAWTQRDLLRLAHPKPPTDDHKAVFYWMVKGWPGVGDEPHPDEALRLIWAFERAKRTTEAAELVRLIRDYRLPRECVPTSFLKDTTVWQALLETDMPMTALIRNLATMTKVGLLAPLSDGSRIVCAQLADRERLRKARVHPIALLSALKVYQQGHGERSDATWKPVAQVVDALDAAFYTAFDLVEPTGKRWVLALDVSGSMGMGTIAGVPGLTPRVASAAMAMVTARVEPQHAFIAFTSMSGSSQSWQTHHQDDGVSTLAISPRQRLDDVVKTVSGLPFGGTDCALPMLWALEHKVEADVFVIYTDSETWAGAIHPAQALRKYREATGIPARLVVCAMTSNGFCIADPDDSGMMDVVGFDTATPELMSGFARGDL